MAQFTSGLSTTLPRNFAPTGLNGLDEPTTPEHRVPEITLPPPPPQHHSTHRIRRPRISNFRSHNKALPTVLFASDIPIPSVEVPRDEAPSLFSWQNRLIASSSPSDRLQLPAQRLHARPKTPLSQTDLEAPEWTARSWAMDRPLSAMSHRSDSSSSSLGSVVSMPSFGGSCTSPESDMTDPFLPHSINIIPDTPTKSSRPFRHIPSTFSTKARWTVEQDNHLWNTYQLYLSDPTITPFKTVPGSLPPLGVCHRVAREARRTWPKATRISYEIVRRHTFRDVMSDSEVMMRGSTPRQERETTPTGLARDDRRPAWPKESVTRRRLKELCKRKFSIAPHYQRLMQSKSPSPFPDSLSRRSPPRSSPPPATSREASVSYATRDLGISLVASGATAPLAQLVTGDSPPIASEDWFNTPVDPPSSPPTVVQHPGLGLGIEHEQFNIPRLASPFKPNTWGPSRARRNQSGSGQFDTVHATGSRLLSPCRLDAGPTGNKRRAEHYFDTDTTTDANDLETAKQELVFASNAADLGQRRIRLRNRGRTLGAVSSRERIEQFFPPLPSTNDSNPPPNPLLSLAVPDGDEKSKRLGSPFELDPNKRSNRSRTPRHIPSLSDPFVSNPFSTQSNTQSIGERLATFGAMQGHSSQNISQLEEGLSDAERIKRQLLSRF